VHLRGRSGIQVVGRHQQLQAQLGRDIHIWDIGLILVLFIVKEVFADFLEDDATTEGVSVRSPHQGTEIGRGMTYVKVSRTQRPVSASENLPIYHQINQRRVQAIEQIHVLAGSSMRRMVPEMQAVLRGRMNSKPSPETNVTYSEAESAMVKDTSREGSRVRG